MDVPARADGTLSVRLALRDVRKRFGTTVALDGATLEVRQGTVHALLGENGAGKTTLMRIAFGLERADAGELLLDGAPRTLRSSREAIAAGIGMVHQHFSLIPALTVAENVALGGRGRFDPRRVEARTRDVAASAGLPLVADALVRDLPVAAQQRVEIVKALARDARVLILDEPTAVLAPSEGAELHAWLRRFVAEGGTAVLITHRLQEALEVSDDVTVLRRGRTALAARTAAVDASAIVRALTGEDLAKSAPAARPAARPAHAAPGAPPVPPDVVLAARDVRYVDANGVTRLDGVSVTAKAGEILGVIGVEGSGERELLRLLAGRLAPTAGTVQRPARVGFIPEDRLHDALIPSLPLRENFALAGAGAHRGRIDWTAMRDRAAAAMRQFEVQARDVMQRVEELSGGNQQRFVVARERATAPQALVAENPSRGLDLRATARVRASLLEAADRGAAVVVYSSDLDEVLGLAHRIVACHAGRVREVTAPTDASDRAAYARAMIGLG